MTMSAKVSGLENLEKKLAQLPGAVREGFLAAQDRAADDFVAKTKAIVPVASGALAASIHKESGKPGAVKVIAGDATAYYAAMVEFGHLSGKRGSANRKHVRGQPFFFTTWRLNRKKYARRIKAAGSRAIKKLLVSGGL